MHSQKDALSPTGFEGVASPAPQDPQAVYKASQPIINSSNPTGTRESEVYAQQTGGMTPKRQGNTC